MEIEDFFKRGQAWKAEVNGDTLRVECYILRDIKKRVALVRYLWAYGTDGLKSFSETTHTWKRDTLARRLEEHHETLEDALQQAVDNVGEAQWLRRVIQEHMLKCG